MFSSEVYNVFSYATYDDRLFQRRPLKDLDQSPKR